MEEVKLKNCDYRILVNGKTKKDIIPNDIMELLVFDLSFQLREKFEKKLSNPQKRPP